MSKDIVYMNIKCPMTGVFLTPQDMITAQLFVTWDIKSDSYLSALYKLRVRMVSDWFEGKTEEDLFLILCREKAELIFESGR